MRWGKNNFRFIFGLKLKYFRQQKELSMKDLSEQTGLSQSYLNEIEKGKKYPKTEKIMQLAHALRVPFDDLVSLSLDKGLSKISDILESPMIQDFPFEFFGITVEKVLEVITNSPSKATALATALIDISRTHDMRAEHFFLAAMRSYQEMHHNYFEDLEEAAERFMKQQKWNDEPPIEVTQLQSVLEQQYGYLVEETAFEDYPELKPLRSVWIDGSTPQLLIHKDLQPSQKAFVLGRELGYCYLDLKERARTASWLKVESFDQVFNHYKAAYFSGALLMNRHRLQKDLKAFFQQMQWDGDSLMKLQKKYVATPETFFYRLSQLIPKFFHMSELHFLRFSHQRGTNSFHLTKELNMPLSLLPQGTNFDEHYCRRWRPITLLKDLEKKIDAGDSQVSLAGAQRVRFIETGEEVFFMGRARPVVLSDHMSFSISLGMRMDETFKKTVRFWKDPEIPSQVVSATCERCPLSAEDCQDRVASPRIYEHQQVVADRNRAIELLISDRKSIGK